MKATWRTIHPEVSRTSPNPDDDGLSARAISGGCRLSIAPCRGKASRAAASASTRRWRRPIRAAMPIWICRAWRMASMTLPFARLTRQTPEMGPNFPPAPSKKRVWRSLNGRVTVQGGRIVVAKPADVLVVSGNTLRVSLQPAWLQGAHSRKSRRRSRHDCYSSYCRQPARRPEHLPVWESGLNSLLRGTQWRRVQTGHGRPNCGACRLQSLARPRRHERQFDRHRDDSYFRQLSGRASRCRRWSAEETASSVSSGAGWPRHRA